MVTEDVVEAERCINADDQALCKFPSNWSQSTADGTVWREAFCWYVGTGKDTLALEQALTKSIGTLFRASQFLSEELPIRLAHRVQELNELPDGLSEFASVKKVADWYAQSFEVSTKYNTLKIPQDL